MNVYLILLQESEMITLNKISEQNNEKYEIISGLFQRWYCNMILLGMEIIICNKDNYVLTAYNTVNTICFVLLGALYSKGYGRAGKQPKTITRLIYEIKQPKTISLPISFTAKENHFDSAASGILRCRQKKFTTLYK